MRGIKYNGVQRKEKNETDAVTGIMSLHGNCQKILNQVSKTTQRKTVLVAFE